MPEKIIIANDQDFLAILYNFVLNPDVKERERLFALAAKRHLEKKAYSITVASLLAGSLQQEAMRNKLSPEASALYQALLDFVNKYAPLGTPRLTGGSGYIID